MQEHHCFFLLLFPWHVKQEPQNPDVHAVSRDIFKPAACTNLPSWHYKGMQGSNGGNTKHDPWYRMESSVMPNQGIAIHMLIPFFFFELKTDQAE